MPELAAFLNYSCLDGPLVLVLVLLPFLHLHILLSLFLSCLVLRLIALFTLGQG